MALNLSKIIDSIRNWLKKIENKLPEDVEAAAVEGDKYVSEAEVLLSSSEAIAFTTIVPESEPLRETILAILQELETGFKAVESAFQKKGTLLVANARIIQAKIPGLPFGHAMSAAQINHDRNAVEKS